MATSRIADSVGRVLGGRYRLTRPLGVGAYAHVFAAEDVQLRRRVAVKLLHPSLVGEDSFLRRFRHEARSVASLRHPNIVVVHDWGEDGDAPYLVMELLGGGSLRAMLDRGYQLSLAQAAQIGAAAGRGLDYAHRQGVIHRDIKPANLLFDDEGRLAVADFGLARALAEAAWTEPAGSVVGTARYAAPEMVQGDQLDGRADVYSLALVLVEMVTGRVPFAVDTAPGTLHGRVGRPMPVPDEMGRLKPILEAAGQADPSARIEAAELVRLLEGAALRLPPPVPLPLGGPLESGLLERNDADPTEYPGRPRLFDLAEHESDPVVIGATPPGASGAPAAGPEPAPAAAAVAATAPATDAPPPVPVPEVVAAPPRRRRRWKAAAIVAIVVLLGGGGGGAYLVMADRPKPLHPVPPLVGVPEAQAQAELNHLHLKLAVSSSAYNPTVKPGSVADQIPSTGQLREGRVVTVVLSLGPQPIPVPNLSGGTDAQATAQQVLTTLGLQATVTTATSMTVPAGYVISQTPASGTLLPGQSVALVVSSGKPQVVVPALSGTAVASYDAAVAALQAVGLAATQQSDYSDSVAAGQVISLNPPGGTTVTIGSTIAVDVSKGPHVVSVPDVRSQSVGAASQAILARGLSIQGVNGNPLATVTGTTPPAGTVVRYGSALVINTG